MFVADRIQVCSRNGNAPDQPARSTSGSALSSLRTEAQPALLLVAGGKIVDPAADERCSRVAGGRPDTGDVRFSFYEKKLRGHGVLLFGASGAVGCTRRGVQPARGSSVLGRVSLYGISRGSLKMQWRLTRSVHSQVLRRAVRGSSARDEAPRAHRSTGYLEVPVRNLCAFCVAPAGRWPRCFFCFTISP